MVPPGTPLRLVLIRPGAWAPPAPDGSGDPLGGLTAAGRAQSRACGRWLRSVAVPLFTAGGFNVLSAPAQPARQTADLLGLGPWATSADLAAPTTGGPAVTVGPQPSLSAAPGPHPSPRAAPGPHSSPSAPFGPHPSPSGDAWPDPSPSAGAEPHASLSGRAWPDPSPSGGAGPQPSPSAGADLSRPAGADLVRPAASELRERVTRWLAGPEVAGAGVAAVVAVCPLEVLLAVRDVVEEKPVGYPPLPGHCDVMAYSRIAPDGTVADRYRWRIWVPQPWSAPPGWNNDRWQQID